MSTPHRGYVYYATVDKRRPALVISHDVRNTHASNVLVIPCSTTMRAMSTHIRLERGEGGLRQASILQCEQITTIPKEQLDPDPLGFPLSRERLREVEAAVMRAIGIPVPLDP